MWIPKFSTAVVVPTFVHFADADVTVPVECKRVLALMTLEDSERDRFVTVPVFTIADEVIAPEPSNDHTLFVDAPGIRGSIEGFCYAPECEAR